MYKMISYKGITGVQSKYTPITAAARLPKVEKSIGRGLQSIVSGLNSLGSTLNSIAANTQNSLTSWRDNIRTQVKSADKIAKQEALTDRKDRKRKAFKDKQTKKRRLFQLRNSKEEKAEKKKGKKAGFGEGVIGATKKAAGGIFGALFQFFGVYLALVKFKIFEWIAKNPKTVAKLGMILGGIGKFVFNVYSFLGGMALDGLVSFLENPISLKGFFGAIKFVLGAVPIFGTMLFLKNPKLMLDGAKKVIGGIVGGLRRLFGFQSKDQKFRDFKLKKLKGGKGNWFGSKVGKIATGLGAGALAFTAVKGEGGSNAEAAGAGVGAAGGQALGAKVGGMLGGPGGAAIGGLVGGLAGGKVGKAIGGLIEPIVKPIGDFFKMIGDTFNGVIKEIKEPLEEFFSTLGKFLSGILDAVEPHMPIITKILGIGFKVLFWPLFLGMKALTAVLKLFTGGEKGEDPGKGDGNKKEDGTKTTHYSTTDPFEAGTFDNVRVTTKDGKTLKKGDEGWKEAVIESREKFRQMMQDPSDNPPKAAGGELPKKAKGGWINGPQSGYPVTLNGITPAFIGHGLEWVGNKKASGGQYIVPFDTPATRSDKGLTSRRLKQAKRAGYSTPFAAGGEYKVKHLHSYEKGGESKDDTKPQGIWRWLAGAADHMTMGLTDFDQRGSILDGARRLKDNIGQKLEDSKQKEQQVRYEKLKNALQDSSSTVIINGETAEVGSSVAASEDNPIIVPGKEHHDADKYIYPKFGIINEFMTDPVEFM